MILTTTPSVEGCHVESYHGIVTGEAALEEVAFSTGVKAGLAKARKLALDELAKAASEMGADAVVSIDFRYVVFSDDTTIVTFTGTAVKFE